MWLARTNGTTKRCFPIIQIVTLLAVSAKIAVAGPVDFGRAELNRALAERGLASNSVKFALISGPPESYSIEAGRVVGADERGLMYGLLEAAEQIRTSGKLVLSSGRPATPMRGIRQYIHNHDLEARWYYSREYWDAYFAMLAHNRFNRFNLVFAHQTNYLAPPYPYWIEIPQFREVQVPGLTEEQRNQNLEMLRYISQSALDHGVDFTLGIWEQNAQLYQTPTVEGLTRENIGPYTHAALKKILELCPGIRSVQVRTNLESGIPKDQQLEFYRDYVFPAIKETGRILDFRAWLVGGGLLDAAKQIGVKTRVSAKYWCEDNGRPYQPPETYSGYGYADFLAKPRWYEFYWEVWGLGSHRILLWGNPAFVRRAIPTFRLSGSIGFEIDAPPTQKGFGNRPGIWDVFTASQQARVFWKWDFERYWSFYLLWGRLSYDPHLSDAEWMDELRRRFGPAAGDVAECYRQSSRVINEIVAVHLADPNMYIWPEINPGGLIDSYREILPSDWRYVASISEVVKNQLSGIVSAKQTAANTADLLEEMAKSVDEAMQNASSKIKGPNREWEGSFPDFKVLASLARYHAHRQRAALNLEWFDKTGDRVALESAKSSLVEALAEWERLVKFTDGLYSPDMANGPDDVGHWKDKLVYIRHDLELIREREETLDRFGQFDFAFAFGALFSGPESDFKPWGNTPYVQMNNVEPRFKPVSPKTIYDDKKGYGWTRDYSGRQETSPAELTPYTELRAVAKNPTNLPRNLLFRNYIRGEGDQEFLVKAPMAKYNVLFISPDHNSKEQSFEAKDGILRIRFPRGDWSISGLVIKGPRAKEQPPSLRLAPILPRPKVSHEPPLLAESGKPLTLLLSISGVPSLTVRLHYRSLNQKDPFRILDGGPAFTIPDQDISSRWDLIYYFEILNGKGSGWFYPDPATATPYFVVTTVL